MKIEKQDLHRLADRLRNADRDTVESCIRFVESESEGIWHGRARAMMCRRFKHIELPKEDADRLVVSILRQFEDGRFAEQFRDLLRLALKLDLDATNDVARRLAEDSRSYVRRQAEWILKNHSTNEGTEQAVSGNAVPPAR